MRVHKNTLGRAIAWTKDANGYLMAPMIRWNLNVPRIRDECRRVEYAFALQLELAIFT